MNLFFRLLYSLLFSRFRKKVGILESNQTPFFVFPTDLDVLMHVNNGVYFSLQDLARVDLMIRSGAMKIINQNGWYPVVINETLNFKKSLELFDKFSIQTKVIGWDEKNIVLEHQFFKKDILVANGYVKARFLKKSGGSVLIKELISALGIDLPVPSIPKEIQHLF